ncbi:MAG TPA: hypothetical protein VNE41_08120 [Chitinophagaceae bacterium]|nr:hypothetical protein [Chitinophagaceae bacterium]
MAAISKQAMLRLENKSKYNDIELDISFGLDEYEVDLTDLDAQIGRGWEIDPEAENMEQWSGYVSIFDTPANFKGPQGNGPDDEDDDNAPGHGFLDNVKSAYKVRDGFVAGVMSSIVDDNLAINTREAIANVISNPTSGWFFKQNKDMKYIVDYFPTNEDLKATEYLDIT